MHTLRYYIIPHVIKIIVYIKFLFINLKITSLFSKFNLNTILYCIYLFVFSILVSKPLIVKISTALSIINIYHYILFLVLILIILRYFRLKLWLILNYFYYKIIKTNTNINTPKQAAAAGLVLPSLCFLPVDHTNSTTASRYWANKALTKRNEASTLELVISKIDIDQPLSSGTSRLSGFVPYILDLHSQALKYDYIARRNQYRNMIMSESKFTINDNFDISSVFV